MDGQISLEEYEAFSFSEEHAVIGHVHDVLSPFLVAENMDFSQFIFEEKENYSSVILSTPTGSMVNAYSLLLRVRFRKKAKYFSVRTPLFNAAKSYLSEDSVATAKADGEFTRLPLSQPQDILYYSDFIIECLKKILNSLCIFDCCEKYEECSDNLRCVCPDRNLALGCRYKRNLRNGLVFYGKNAIE